MPISSAQCRRRIEPWLAWTIAGTAVALIVAIALLVGSIPSVTASATDVAPGLDSRTANLLQYDPLTGMSAPAPSFTLRDQNGKSMSLADYRGKPVVLSFNDDECVDLCTLLAQDVRVANKDLGPAAEKIAFVSINANPYYPSTSSVRHWTDEHGLNNATNWHFGTGKASDLLAVAQAYGVPIGLDPKQRTVTHGAEIFFIDGHGDEKAIGQFGTEAADTASFGHALAQAADDLLPSSEQTSVVGSGVAAPQASGSEIGALPSPVTLPSLDGHGRVSTRQDRGKYTVIDFWSSSCSACIRGLAALQREYTTVGAKVAFVGIDVSDPTTAGRAFAAKNGITFPLTSDRSGSNAGRFAVTGLPYTVILDPTGKVVIRHPGAFTTGQLDFLLFTLDPSLSNQP